MIKNPAPLWVAVVVACAGGLLLRTSFPAPGIWPFAFLGLALILFSLRGRGFWTGVLVGFVAGATLWGSLIFWLTLYLGPIPWLALCTLMTLWVGLSCGVIAVIYRWSDAFGSAGLRYALVPALIAAVWSARETLASSWPYGGFSWARLAYSQAQSPFGHSVSWVGTAGVSFLIAFVTALGVAILVSPLRRAMVMWGAIVVGLALLPVFGTTSVGTMRILVAQGNSNAGLFAQHEPGDILADHVSATLEAQGDPRARNIDAIVWPENAADIDPLQSPVAAATLSEVSRTFDAPVVTGTITNPRNDEFFNSSLVWMHGQGVLGQYDKMRPVPFAEYMPNRAFFRALVPDLVDLVGRDYSFGTRSNVVTVAGVPVGISICFDITDNTLTTRMVDRGAQVIFAQTNNADFGTTDENLQQLAIARLTAMETGRTVINDSTVGLTAVLASDGTTQSELQPYQTGYLIADVTLSTTVTPAVLIGRSVELVICACALAGLVAVAWQSRKRRGSIRRGLRGQPLDVPEEMPNAH